MIPENSARNGLVGATTGRVTQKPFVTQPNSQAPERPTGLH